MIKTILLLLLFPTHGFAQDIYLYQPNNIVNSFQLNSYSINDKYNEFFKIDLYNKAIYSLDNNSALIKTTKYCEIDSISGLTIFPNGNKLLLDNYGYLDLENGSISTIPEFNQMYKRNMQNIFRRFFLIGNDNNTIIGLSESRDTVFFYGLGSKSIENIFVPNDNIFSMCRDSNNLYMLSENKLLFYSFKEKKIIKSIDNLNYYDIVISGCPNYMICKPNGQSSYFDLLNLTTCEITKIECNGNVYGISNSVPCVSYDANYFYYADQMNIYRYDLSNSKTDKYKSKYIANSTLLNISSDGKELYITTDDDYLFKLSLVDGKFYNLNSTSMIKKVLFSNDSKYLITIGIRPYYNDELYIYAYNLLSKELVGYYLLTPQLNYNTDDALDGQDVTYSPLVISDDNIAYTVIFNNGSEGGNRISKMDLSNDLSYEAFIPIGKRTVTDMVLSKDNKEIVCTCTDSSVLIINIADKSIKQIRIPSKAFSVQYDKELGLLYYFRSSDGYKSSAYNQYDLNNNKEVYPINKFNSFFGLFSYNFKSGCSFSANKEYVAVYDYDSHHVSMINNNSLSYTFKNYEEVNSLALSSDITLLAIGLDSASIDVVKTDSFDTLFSIKNYPYTNSMFGNSDIPRQTCIAISPDKRFLASANTSMNLCVWDIASFTNVDDKSNVDFSQTFAYPNPVKELLNIKYTSIIGIQVKLSVMDVFGRSILEKSSISSVEGANTISANVGNLPQGCYFYRLILNNKVFSNKFTIIK